MSNVALGFCIISLEGGADETVASNSFVVQQKSSAHFSLQIGVKTLQWSVPSTDFWRGQRSTQSHIFVIQAKKTKKWEITCTRM